MFCPLLLQIALKKVPLFGQFMMPKNHFLYQMVIEIVDYINYTIFYTIDNSHFMIFIAQEVDSSIPSLWVQNLIKSMLPLRHWSLTGAQISTILVANMTDSKILVPMVILVILIHLQSINGCFETKSTHFGQKMCFLFKIDNFFAVTIRVSE